VCSSLASAPVSVELGSATHRRKGKRKYDHITDTIMSRPSLAAGETETTHSVQAGHDGVQVHSSHGAVVPIGLVDNIFTIGLFLVTLRYAGSNQSATKILLMRTIADLSCEPIRNR